MSVRVYRWGAGGPKNRTERLSYLEAPRPTSLRRVAPRIVKLPMMLRLACGAQQKGPELIGLGPDVMSSVKGDTGTRNHLDLLLNA